MKPILIALLMLPLCLLFTGSVLARPSDYSSAVTDTAKKAPTAKEMKQFKKAMKNLVPKAVSDVMVNTVTSGKIPDLTDMPSSMTKMNYMIERNLLIADFKNNTYNSSSEKREARKEMNKDLKQLKKEYRKELKETKQEEKEGRF